MMMLNVTSTDLLYMNGQYYLSQSFMHQVTINYVYCFMVGMVLGVGLALLLNEVVIPFVKIHILKLP